MLRSVLRSSSKPFNNLQTATNTTKGKEFEEEEKDSLLSDFTLRSKVVEFLNLLAGSHPHHEEFYEQVVHSMKYRFGGQYINSNISSSKIKDVENVTTAVTAPDDYTPMELFSLVSADLGVIISYILNMTGFQLAPNVFGSTSTLHYVKFQFTAADVVDGVARVKHMATVDVAEARWLTLQADTVLAAENSSTEDKTTSVPRLLSLATEHYKSASAAEPNNFVVLYERARSEARGYESLGEHRLADITTIRTLEVSFEKDANAVVVLIFPLLNFLLDVWQARRETGGVHSYLHCGGASSNEMLRRVKSILDKLDIMISAQSNKIPALTNIKIRYAEAQGYRTCAASRFWFVLKKSSSDLLKEFGHRQMSEFLNGQLASVMLKRGKMQKKHCGVYFMKLLPI